MFSPPISLLRRRLLFWTFLMRRLPASESGPLLFRGKRWFEKHPARHFHLSRPSFWLNVLIDCSAYALFRLIVHRSGISQLLRMHGSSFETVARRHAGLRSPNSFE